MSRLHNIALTFAIATLAMHALQFSTSSAEPEVDCNNALSTVEMNFCADRDFAAADAALNAAYQKALQGIPHFAMDPPFDAPRWEKALRQSQRAWVAFRDAECKDHVAMFWTGGSGTTVAVLGCMTDKTKERTREIEEAYSER